MKTTLLRAGRWILSGSFIGLVACQSAPTETQLLRLRLLDDELLAINDKVAAANSQKESYIRKEVEKAHNLPKDVAVLRQSAEVRTETKRLVGYLRGLRRQLRPAGSSPTLEQLADRRAVAQVLLSGGQADSLQGRLNRYAASMLQVIGYGSTPLAAAGDDPRVRALVGGKMAGQSFGEFYFQDAPVATALAVLAQQEAAVLRLESDVQSELGKKVGGGGWGFEKIGAFAVVESNTVAAGETYRAELFLTSSASNLRPRMTLNGQPLEISPDGKGRVTFTAPRLAPGQRRRTVYWDGTISSFLDGRDTTFRVRVPYTIVPRR